MGLVISEKNEILLHDDSYIAVRQDGHVELWTGDGGTWVGNLPEKATEDDVDAVLRIYARGMDRGKDVGRVGLAEDIRRMLGLV